MAIKTYDPACYNLAEHFLRNEPWSDDPELYKKHCHTLALEVQQAVADGPIRRMNLLKPK